MRGRRPGCFAPSTGSSKPDRGDRGFYATGLHQPVSVSRFFPNGDDPQWGLCRQTTDGRRAAFPLPFAGDLKASGKPGDQSSARGLPATGPGHSTREWSSSTRTNKRMAGCRSASASNDGEGHGPASGRTGKHGAARQPPRGAALGANENRFARRRSWRSIPTAKKQEGVRDPGNPGTVSVSRYSRQEPARPWVLDQRSANGFWATIWCRLCDPGVRGRREFYGPGRGSMSAIMKIPAMPANVPISRTR